MFLVRVNNEQLAVIQEIFGPCLVIAGAGTGKTATITKKIQFLLEKNPQEKILGLTFTNKAAKEMQDRLKALGIKSSSAQMMTFHRLGLTLLKKYSSYLDLASGFSLLHHHDRYQILAQLYPTLDKDHIYELCQHISSIKQYAHQDFWPQHLKEVASLNEIFLEYQETLKNMHCVDIDDLVYLSYKILQHPICQQDVHAYWKYIFIDEYQDTNQIQYQLFRLLQSGGRFTAVGDDDQSIYGWRGAHSQNLEYIIKDFEDLKIFKLEQNFRCTSRILKAAHNLISKNPHVIEKKIWSDKQERELSLELFESPDAAQEIQKILNDIEARRSLNKEIGIIFRTNYQSLDLEKALKERGWGYHFLGGSSLFEKPAIIDLICYLRLISNPQDDLAFKRIINTPKRQIGPKKIGDIARYAQEHKLSFFRSIEQLRFLYTQDKTVQERLKDFSRMIHHYQKTFHHSSSLDWIEQMLAEIDYFGWIEEKNDHKKGADKEKKEITDFIFWLKRAFSKDPNLEDILRKTLILDRIEKSQKEQALLVLGTIHSVKGLEFEEVYILGCNEGLIPHSEDYLEEERRLFYVAMTRAKERLVLSCSAFDKNQNRLEPSRFIGEIGTDFFGQAGITSLKKECSWEEMRAQLGL